MGDMVWLMQTQYPSGFTCGLPGCRYCVHHENVVMALHVKKKHAAVRFARKEVCSWDGISIKDTKAGHAVLIVVDYREKRNGGGVTWCVWVSRRSDVIQHAVGELVAVVAAPETTRKMQCNMFVRTVYFCNALYSVVACWKKTRCPTVIVVYSIDTWLCICLLRDAIRMTCEYTGIPKQIFSHSMQ